MKFPNPFRRLFTEPPAGMDPAYPWLLTDAFTDSGEPRIRCQSCGDFYDDGTAHTCPPPTNTQVLAAAFPHHQLMDVWAAEHASFDRLARIAAGIAPAILETPRSAATVSASASASARLYAIPRAVTRHRRRTRRSAGRTSQRGGRIALYGAEVARADLRTLVAADEQAAEGEVTRETLEAAWSKRQPQPADAGLTMPSASDLWPFAPGDVVRDSGPEGDDAAWLDAAPEGTVVRDEEGDDWTRTEEAWVWSPGNGPVVLTRDSAHLAEKYAPLTVVSVGGAS